MKIDLVYPKIGWTEYPLTQCIAFEKYDGSNLHWVYQNKNWIAFGTRRTQFMFNQVGQREFAQEHPELSEAYALFSSILAARLSDRLQKLNIDKAICFTEFWGEKSLRGEHQAQDSKFLTLIDMEINGKLLTPDKLITNFQDFPELARVVYRGKYNGQLIEDIRKGKFGVKEGVVCKGEKDEMIYMVKIKTDQYMKEK